MAKLNYVSIYKLHAHIIASAYANGISLEENCWECKHTGHGDSRDKWMCVIARILDNNLVER